MERHGKISLRPGFWLKCDACDTWAWLRAEMFEEQACPGGRAGVKCQGMLRMQHATAPEGVMTAWDDMVV
jgi:hypothetical protein